MTNYLRNTFITAIAGTIVYASGALAQNTTSLTHTLVLSDLENP